MASKTQVATRFEAVLEYNVKVNFLISNPNKSELQCCYGSKRYDHKTFTILKNLEFQIAVFHDLADFLLEKFKFVGFLRRNKMVCSSLISNA